MPKLFAEMKIEIRPCPCGSGLAACASTAEADIAARKERLTALADLIRAAVPEVPM